jgi:hypothetical protein
MHVPFVFSNTQPYPPFAIAIFFFLLTVHMGSAPPPLSGSHSYKLSLSKVAGRVQQLLPSLASLLIYRLPEELPLPHSLELRTPCPLCYMSFFFSCLFIIQFGFFLLGWESVCPGGYADLAQGCLWEYHMPLNSPGGLLLPSRIGAGVWQHRSPPSFSI